MDRVVTLATPELGDRSYLVHDGEQALVVDPQRDIDRLLQAAAEAGVRITHVAETHLHNDYLSGGLELARVTGAEYLVAAAEEVAFERHPVVPGEVVRVGRLRVAAVGTPGHTAAHLAYVVGDEGGPFAVLTGGSLLLGAVGRTDLVDPRRSEELTRAQYRSARALAGSLPDEVEVLPTHGFGSFCSAMPPAEGSGPTMGSQRASNPALLVADEEEFVRRVLSGLTAYPSYYARMAPANRAGAPPLPAPPPPVDPAELSRLIGSSWVVDLRPRRAFARTHLSGTLSFELAMPFTTYLGWVLPAPPDQPGLVLLGGGPDQLTEASRALARIGLEPSGGCSGTTEELARASGLWLGSFPAVGFADLARAWDRQPTVLDVRRPDEWRAGHLSGARNVFVALLPSKLAELPGGTLWVHCASGYRAAVAASLLARAGREVVLVDDEWAAAVASGLPIEEG